MRRIQGLACGLCLASALAFTATAARAQAGLSLWAGIGGSARAGVSTFARDAKQLGAQLTIPLVPFGVRAEALMLGSRLSADAISYSFNAVAALQLPLVQPYAILGRGKYAIAPELKEVGWNAGGGVRVGLARLGAFVEMRRHYPLHRTITTLGVTF